MRAPTTPDSGRNAGFEALRQLEVDQLIADVASAAALLSRPVAKCGLLGLSVGAYIGFVAATRLPFADIALAYPGWLASTTPPIASSERAADQLAMIRGRLLIVVGGDDALVGPAEQNLLSQVPTARGDEILVLPRIAHGFLCPTRPTHNPDAADVAWQRFLAHLTPDIDSDSGPNRRPNRQPDPSQNSRTTWCAST